MGGSGSSRWGAHTPAPTVESSLALPVRAVVTPHDGPQLTLWAGYTRTATIDACAYEQDGGYQVRVRSTVLSADGRMGAQELFIVTHQTAAGIPQHRWQCPLSPADAPCPRLVRTLYLPPDGEAFGCRHCHGLVYASSQRHNKRYDYLVALLRGDEDTARRYQATYDRAMDRLDRHTDWLRRHSP